MRLGRFWGYGDPEPRLVVLLDSLTMVKGAHGTHDASTVVQWLLSRSLCRTLVISYPGAQVLYGDYMDMVQACNYLEAVVTLASRGRVYSVRSFSEWQTTIYRCFTARPFPSLS